MDRSNSYKTFNSLMNEFFVDLGETFNDFDVIGIAKNSLDGILAMNDENETPARTFFDLFHPHEDYLHSKNATIFSLCKIPFIEDSGEFVLSDVWLTLDPDNQDALWEYLQVLYKMSKKCIE